MLAAPSVFLRSQGISTSGTRQTRFQRYNRRYPSGPTDGNKALVVVARADVRQSNLIGFTFSGLGKAAGSSFLSTQFSSKKAPKTTRASAIRFGP